MGSVDDDGDDDPYAGTSVPNSAAVLVDFEYEGDGGSVAELIIESADRSTEPTSAVLTQLQLSGRLRIGLHFDRGLRPSAAAQAAAGAAGGTSPLSSKSWIGAGLSCVSFSFDGTPVLNFRLDTVEGSSGSTLVSSLLGLALLHI